MNELKNIGFEIRKARLAKNLTMGYVASSIGITRATLFSIEKGNANFSVTTLLKLCNFLGISFVIGENLKEQANRSRASRKNTKRNKQINGFIIMCVEMYSKYKGLNDQRTYSLLKENNILNMLENDYDDLHGMGTEWLNNYIDSLVVVR